MQCLRSYKSWQSVISTKKAIMQAWQSNIFLATAPLYCYVCNEYKIIRLESSDTKMT